MIRQFLKNKNIVLHQFSGTHGDGSFGRIAVFKNYFDQISGYDESFEPMGYEDDDLILRLINTGLRYFRYADASYPSAIANTRNESIINTCSNNTWEIMQKINNENSFENIESGYLIANNGIYGIKDELYDYKGRLFNPSLTD